MAKGHTTVAIDKDLHHKVRVLCAVEGRTISGLIAMLLQEYMDKKKEG